MFFLCFALFCQFFEWKSGEMGGGGGVSCSGKLSGESVVEVAEIFTLLAPSAVQSAPPQTKKWNDFNIS